MPEALSVLSEEEALFQASVRQFARERVAPHVRAMDESGVFRKDLLKDLFDLGLMSIDVPEDLGGQGGTFFQAILAIEELAKVDPSASVIVDVHNALFNAAILQWGSDEQKRRILPKACAGALASYALSEAGSGSDAFALTTRAVEDGDHYILNGRKLWITNAAEAHFFLVFATVNPDLGYKGVTAFLVERDTPGFAVGKKEDKLGIRASSTCELLLDNCRIAKANILGEVGKGYKVAIETLNAGRIGIGAQMTGLAAGALDHALAYARERKQFGKPIGDFQGVQFELAEMAVDVEAARLPALLVEGHDPLQIAGPREAAIRAPREGRHDLPRAGGFARGAAAFVLAGGIGDAPGWRIIFPPVRL